MRDSARTSLGRRRAALRRRRWLGAPALIVALSLVYGMGAAGQAAGTVGSARRQALHEALERSDGVVLGLVLDTAGGDETRVLVVRTEAWRGRSPRPGSVVILSTDWGRPLRDPHELDRGGPQAHRLVPGHALVVPASFPASADTPDEPARLACDTRLVRQLLVADVVDSIRARGLLSSLSRLRQAALDGDDDGLARGALDLLDRHLGFDGVQLINRLEDAHRGTGRPRWTDALGERATELLCAEGRPSWTASVLVKAALRYGPRERTLACLLGQLRAVADQGLPLPRVALWQYVHSLAAHDPDDELRRQVEALDETLDLGSGQVSLVAEARALPRLREQLERFADTLAAVAAAPDPVDARSGQRR